MPAIAGFWAVIPAGGAGTRLWPLSRAGLAQVPARPHRHRPHPAAGDRPTGSRRWPADRVLVVTGRAHRGRRPRAAARLDAGRARRAVAARLDGRDRAGRGDPRAPDPDAVMGSFAADHVIRDPAAFERACAQAVERGARRLAGDDRHRADAAGHRRSATSSRATRSPRRPRRLVVARVRREADRRASPGRTSHGRVPLERRHVRRPRRPSLLDLLGASWHPDARRRLCATIAAEPERGSSEIWPTPDEDRHRPRRRRARGGRGPGRRRCPATSAGTTSATSPLCGRSCRPPDAGAARARRRRPGARRRRRRAGRARRRTPGRGGRPATTSSSSTPPTRCW